MGEMITYNPATLYFGIYILTGVVILMCFAIPWVHNRYVIPDAGVGMKVIMFWPLFIILGICKLVTRLGGKTNDK